MEPIRPVWARQFAIAVLAVALVVLGVALLGPGGFSGAHRELPGSDSGVPSTGSSPVRPGVSVLLADSFHLVAGRRVGLITNQTGVDGRGRSSIDLLAEASGTELVALFSPEHGIRGTAAPGAGVGDTVDPATGLPVGSLYGEIRRPTPSMLEGIEVLLFDLQDVGARYYTYVSTMALAMTAAGEAGIPFVVLDRPNPLGGVAVQGNVLDPEHSSFVGMYPVPMRHGMTPGELARMIVGEFGVRVRLHVVPAEGWRREMWFDQTGLPWVTPSPNLPGLTSAVLYPGTCLFEGTVLSVGRGTDAPFQQVGAPWLDGVALARALNDREIPGVRFEAVSFLPRDPGDGKYPGRRVHGVRFRVQDRDVLDPTAAAVAALVEARRQSGDRWEWNRSHFDRLAGGEELRRRVQAGTSPGQITEGWRPELRQFRARRAPYLIYPRR